MPHFFQASKKSKINRSLNKYNRVFVRHESQTGLGRTTNMN